MSRVRAAALTAAASLALLGTGVLPAQADPVVVGADALSEVRPEGARVVAITVELSEALPADLDVPLADVTVTVGDDTRTVQDVYVTDEARPGAPEGGGELLYVALDPTDDAAPAVYPDELVGEYTVTLASPVTQDDVVLLPAFEVANRAVLTDVVDDFAAGSLTGSTGATLNFRLFTPEGADGAEVPLVVFLHGGGEVGEDNVAQLTANRGAVAFADPAWQAEHPAYVLAPQLPLPADSQWEMPEIQTALGELVDQALSLPGVDEDRVYLTGLSRGARGALQLWPTDTDRFAAALIAAGRASQDGSTEHLAALAGLPLWATHSVDDDVVSYVDGTLAVMEALEDAGGSVARGSWAGDLPAAAAEAEAANLWEEAQAAGITTLFTTFEEGTTPVAPHFSWIPTYGNTVMLEWLFAQVRQAEEPTPTPTPAPTTPEPTDPAPVPSEADEPGGVVTPPSPARGEQLPATGAPALATAGLVATLVLGGALLLAARRRGVRG